MYGDGGGGGGGGLLSNYSTPCKAVNLWQINVKLFQPE